MDLQIILILIQLQKLSDVELSHEIREENFVKGGGNGSYGFTEKNYKDLEIRQLGFRPILELRTSPVNHIIPSNVKDKMSLKGGEGCGPCSCRHCSAQ